MKSGYVILATGEIGMERAFQSLMEFCEGADLAQIREVTLHSRTIPLAPEIAERYNRLLVIEEVDFEKESIPSDATLFHLEYSFEDGVHIDFGVYSGQTNLWTEIEFLHGGQRIAGFGPDYVIETKAFYHLSGDTLYELKIEVQKPDNR